MILKQVLVKQLRSKLKYDASNLTKLLEQNDDNF